MAKNTGKGTRKGAVKGRTQVKNPRAKRYVERDIEEGSPSKGEFKNVKGRQQAFQGRSKEPDKRRTKS